jgi:hypothetical protein
MADVEIVEALHDGFPGHEGLYLHPGEARPDRGSLACGFPVSNWVVREPQGLLPVHSRASRQCHGRRIGLSQSGGSVSWGRTALEPAALP